jgi:hypothetical protein
MTEAPPTGREILLGVLYVGVYLLVRLAGWIARELGEDFRDVIDVPADEHLPG